VTEPVTASEPAPQAPAYPDFSQSASPNPASGYDNPFGSPAASGGVAPSAPVPPTENPFTYQVNAAPAAPPRGNGKKILLLILLLLLLLGIGFVAFTSIGKLLSKNQPIVLNYWGLWENEQLLTPLVEEYQKSHPTIQIAYTKQSIKQYRERLQAAIGRGEGPDIFRYHSTWLPMLKDDVAPAGKTGYTAEEFKQTFYPVATQDLVYANQVYGVPLMIDGLGLYYNEDLLRSAGVTPPTSWEEFRQATLSLTVKDQSGQIVTAGAALGTTGNVEHFSDILAVMMLQNGADLKNPVSNEAQQALSFYHLFAEKPNNVWDETLDNSILAFANGKVAFLFAPSWQAFTIKETNPQLKFQIIPIPQLPGTNVTWASYWAEGVSSKSTHKDEAWDFLKFLSSKDSLVKLHTEEAKTRAFGEPYSRVDLAQTLINDPLVGAYIRQAPTAQSFFLSSRTYDNGINDRMIKYLEDAVNSLTRSVSPQAALQTAAQGFAQVLSSFGFATAAPPAQK
jgi:multiple sugar transport system substrate-binding protein